MRPCSASAAGVRPDETERWSVPVVCRQRPDHVDGGAAAIDQEIAKRSIDGAKGHCLDASAACRLQVDAEMAGADETGVDQPVPRQRQQRLRMPPPRMDRQYRGRRPPAPTFAPSADIAASTSRLSSACSPKIFGCGTLLEKRTQRTEAGPFDGDAGSHRVATALDDQPFGRRQAHQPAKVEAGDGAARAGAGAIEV